MMMITITNNNIGTHRFKEDVQAIGNKEMLPANSGDRQSDARVVGDGGRGGGGREEEWEGISGSGIE